MQDNLVPRLGLEWLRRVRRLENCRQTPRQRRSPSSPPFDFDSGMKEMTNHFEKEAVGRQTAPAPEISTPTPWSDYEMLDVSGSPATVQSTLGRHKHSRARRPSSVEDRDSSNEDGEATPRQQ